MKGLRRHTIFACVVSPLAFPAYALDELSFEQVLQKSVDNAINLRIAELQYQRSLREKDKLDSMFGWQVGNQINASHDVGFGSIPTNSLNANANANRLLTNGDRVSATAGYTFSSAETALIPSLPNPTNDLKIDLSYRRPFWQGSNNPSYEQGRISALAAESIANESRQLGHDQIANQAIEIYYGAISTLERIKNTGDAIERTKRLMEYFKRKESLGLSEQKDLLQIEAQLKAQDAELKALRSIWEQQRTALNRLMNQTAGNDFHPAYRLTSSTQVLNRQALIDEAVAYHPGIRIQQQKIKIAGTAIERARDNRKSKLDGFVTIGGRGKYGDVAAFGSTPASTVNEVDYAVMVGIDYQRALDKRNVDLEIEQAELDKTIALQEIDVIRRDIEYNVASLLNEIDTIAATIKAYETREEKERQKLDEAVERYRRGRADTQQLILFENDLHTAEFLAKQQKIELAKRYVKLDLLRGAIWQRVVPASKKEDK